MEGKNRRGRLTLITLLILVSACLGREIEICPSCEYRSIKEALKASQQGDILIVRKGTYKEGTIVVSRSVKLIGVGGPILDGEGKYEVLRIEADNVLVEGFYIVNSGRSELEDLAGIKVENVTDCVLRNNTFKENFWAIYLANVRSCVVEGNLIEGPFRAGEVHSGNGIHVWQGKGIVIRNNKITGHRDGIYFEFVQDSKITENVSELNWRYGLHFMFSHNNIYERNVFRRNGVGVAVMYSKRVTMRGNRFELNWGGASYGLLLKAIDDSVVEENIFYKNTTGILMDECQRTVIRKNDFVENGWALRIWSNSAQNLITLNNFILNTFELSTSSPRNPNRIDRNYWSSYRGYDLDGDGVGDIPYRPVKLYSYIVEVNPSASVLIKSFFVELLNLLEETIPVIVPIDVKDSNPLMEKVR